MSSHRFCPTQAGIKRFKLRVGYTFLMLTMGACLPLAQATTSFTATADFPGGVTDASQPVSANAVFTFVSTGNITVQLNDTTTSPISDAPNLADLSFVFSSLTTAEMTGSSVTNADGQTITGITDNASNNSGTLGSFTGASPWTLASGTTGWWTQSILYPGTTDSFDLYATAPSGPPAPGGCLPNTAPYSIVGGTNGSYPQSGTGASIGSANPLTSGCDGTMFYKSVTFNLSIPGLTLADFQTLANVAFGLGPDGANSPDGDDIGKGVLTANTATTPEPATMALLGMGVVGMGLLRVRFRYTIENHAVGDGSGPEATGERST